MKVECGEETLILKKENGQTNLNGETKILQEILTRFTGHKITIGEPKTGKKKKSTIAV